MNKGLQKAVAGGDIVAVREILVEMVSGKTRSVERVEEITEVVGNMGGLFEPDDGKRYAAHASELTQCSVAELKEDVRANFSLPKFRLLSEVCELLRDAPAYYEGRGRTLRDTICSAAEQAEICSQVDSEREEELAHPGGKAGRIVGYVMIAIGFAASVTGVCLPVNFLTGVGIGVLMLGTAMVYASLPRR